MRAHNPGRHNRMSAYRGSSLRYMGNTTYRISSIYKVVMMVIHDGLSSIYHALYRSFTGKLQDGYPLRIK